MRTARRLRKAGKSAWLAALPLFLLATLPARGETVSVAVASNFRVPAQALADTFTRDTGYAVRLSAASTGKHYAQIVNGAPFDVFLAADADRPARLEAGGQAVPDSRFTYAIGSLVLWSKDPGLVEADCRAELASPGNWRLAIANPELAPYGAAAKEFLEGEGLWQAFESRLVFGENIAQTLHFVATGNARFGLIAAAQADDPRLPAATCRWAVPTATHTPIEQQAVLLGRAGDAAPARAFVEFLRGETARSIVTGFGFETRQ